ncbi:YotG [Bacillus atrophaeus UCMB-5137]|uniref:hypothetical protein n=1 Tax=Bacillus atrophaeus TaxID=1452 RepID=UPI00032D9A95|nr:hypothetical protein [Bacillus atrophaeus]AKL83299.1 YotG [Bacillus atrophaeus UCMB-5137]
MNIREWFELEPMYAETKVNESVDRMLILCRDALSEYFSISDSKDINELIQKAYESRDKSLDEPFLEWLLEKGLPRLHNIDFSNLPDNEKLIAMIEIDEFVLENEMDFSDPEEVRACIISFVNSLPEYISSCSEIAASIEDDIETTHSIEIAIEENAYEIIDDYIIGELVSGTLDWGSAEQVPFYMEEFTYGNF